MSTPATADLAAFAAALSSLPPATDDSERLERIRVLEELKGAVAAAQAVETAAFAVSRRAEHARRHTKPEHVERDIAGQVGLARRMSPHQARRYVGFAGVLVRELPKTFAVLQRGQTSEWRASMIAQHTIWLSREHRAEVDQAVERELPGLGDKRTETLTREHAYRLDPVGFTDRLRNAAKDRRVSLRPAPDTMTRFSALLPVVDGVAVYACLRQQADAQRSAGDSRSRDQLMADTLVNRVLGTTSDQVPVEINLVMTDSSLLGRSDDPAAAEPAHMVGFGPIPAGTARELVAAAPDGAPRWLRRVFRAPGTGELAAMDSSRRLFTPAQRRFVQLRDQFCRTPYCGAPIRHIDHVRAHERGGSTTVSNAQGLCEACNHLKQAPGWHSVVEPDGAISIRTPARHRYVSRPPRPPISADARAPLPLRTPAVPQRSRVERHFAIVLAMQRRGTCPAA